MSALPFTSVTAFPASLQHTEDLSYSRGQGEGPMSSELALSVEGLNSIPLSTARVRVRVRIEPLSTEPGATPGVLPYTPCLHSHPPTSLIQAF